MPMQIMIDGEQRDMTPEEEAAFIASLPTQDPSITSEMVNAERDRRIASGFTFAGKHFAFDAASKARISGGATLAGFAIGKGAPEGFLFWHGGLMPFAWIADDNSLVEMDAQTCLMFGQVAANHETAHIFAARALKDMDPIPLDFADDQNWP